MLKMSPQVASEEGMSRLNWLKLNFPKSCCQHLDCRSCCAKLRQLNWKFLQSEQANDLKKLNRLAVQWERWAKDNDRMKDSIDLICKLVHNQIEIHIQPMRKWSNCLDKSNCNKAIRYCKFAHHLDTLFRCVHSLDARKSKQNDLSWKN